MKFHRHSRMVILLAAAGMLAPGATCADDAGGAAKMMPADAGTHGRPMKMDEPMPTRMKKDGMMKEEVMKGEMEKGKVMNDALKQEESTLQERH